MAAKVAEAAKHGVHVAEVLAKQRELVAEHGAHAVSATPLGSIAMWR